MMEATDEKDETLSLSDYSINPSPIVSKHYDNLFPVESHTQYNPTYVPHQDPIFEFISEDWSITADASIDSHGSIIFCGKILVSSAEPFSQNSIQENPPLPQLKSEKDVDYDNIQPAEEVAWWNKLRPVFKSSSSSRFSVEKVGIPASPRKLKWYFLFGIRKYPMEMEVKDMKGRQSRKNASSSKLFGLGGGEKKKKTLFGLGGGEKKKKKEEMSACKGEGEGVKGVFNLLGWHQIKFKSQCFGPKC